MSSTTRSLALSGSLAGKSFSGQIRRDGSTETNGQALLAAGSPGTVTGRTDADTGVCTVTGTHGLATSDKVDVFWAGGIRRGMTATVAGQAITVDGGAGDDLPVLTTAVVVDRQEVIDFDSDDATIVLAAVSQQRRASVEFQQDAGTPIKSLDLGRHGEADAEPWVWAADSDVANPFGAAVSKVAVSNGSSAGANTVTIGVLRS